MASSNKGLLLHVGLPKTGTTTLQQALFSDHSQLYYLGKHDVKVNSIEKGCLSEDVYNVLQSVLWDVNRSYDIEETEQLYQQNILSELPDDKLMLCSWEALGNRPTEAHLEMLGRVQRIFGNCRVLYVLRNPITQVPSEYLQNVSGKFVNQGRSWMGSSAFLSIEAWFEQRSGKSSLQCDVLNYTQNIKASIERLGKENVGVFLFEDLMNDPESYYRSISDFIGIEADEAYAHSQQKHFHPRITQGQLDLIRMLESNFLTKKLLPCFTPRWRRLLLKNMAKSTGPAKVSLTPELHEKISTATKEGHHWLVENLNLPLAQYNYPL